MSALGLGVNGISDGDWLVDTSASERRDREVGKAVGEELRRAREARGWSRAELVHQLPSGVGERTLLSYEHGTRRLYLLRFLEICWILGVDPSSTTRSALQRARINLDKMIVRVDLRALSRDESATYRPIRQWARNTLNEHPDGFIDVEPIVVKHLSLSIGCDHDGLVNHLARFIPDDY